MGIEPSTRSKMRYFAKYFGTGGGLFGVVFKNLLLTVVTLGVYLPWARTERRKYLWQNVEFDGQRLRYHGTGREMLRGYLKVALGYLLFIIVPLVITRFDRMAGMIAQFVGFAILLPLIPIAVYGSRRYLLSRTSLRGIRFGLDVGVWGYLREFLGGFFLTVVTLGLYGPAMQNRLRGYLLQRTRYGTALFDYDGETWKAWKISMKGFVLSVLTLGLYFPWYAAEIARFRAAGTYVRGARARLDLSGRDMFWLLVFSILGTVLSFGLAFPWITTYAMRLIASRMTFEGKIDYAAIGGAAVVGDATADGLADALDVGLEI